MDILHLFLTALFEIWGVFYFYSTSQLRLAMVQVHGSHPTTWHSSGILLHLLQLKPSCPSGQRAAAYQAYETGHTTCF